jgi:hypothetical protein
MAYHLTFFCRSGEENGSSALATFLSKLTETGDPVLIERSAADYADQVDVCELATDNGSAMPASGWLILQFSVGIEYNAMCVPRTARIAAALSDAQAQGTWFLIRADSPVAAFSHQRQLLAGVPGHAGDRQCKACPVDTIGSGALPPWGTSCRA